MSTRSPISREYQEAELGAPGYDITGRKYTPQRAAGDGSRQASVSGGAVHEPWTSKKARACEDRRTPSAEAPSAEALSSLSGYLWPPRIPPGLSGDHGRDPGCQARQRERAAEVEDVAPAKRSRRPTGSGSTTPVIDVLIEARDEPPAALLSRICPPQPRLRRRRCGNPWSDRFGRGAHRLRPKTAWDQRNQGGSRASLRRPRRPGDGSIRACRFGEKILTDPVLLARHICRGQETGEAVSRRNLTETPVGGRPNVRVSALGPFNKRERKGRCRNDVQGPPWNGSVWTRPDLAEYPGHSSGGGARSLCPNSVSPRFWRGVNLPVSPLMLRFPLRPSAEVASDYWADDGIWGDSKRRAIGGG
nr:hypothetical protein Iba_chr12aCG21200 [Ipomoea batatas]